MAASEMTLALTPGSQALPWLLTDQRRWSAWLPRLALAMVLPGGPLMLLAEWAGRNEGYPRGMPWYMAWPSGAVGCMMGVLAWRYWEIGPLTPWTLLLINTLGSILLFPALLLAMLPVAIAAVGCQPLIGRLSGRPAHSLDGPVAEATPQPRAAPQSMPDPAPEDTTPASARHRPPPAASD